MDKKDVKKYIQEMEIYKVSEIARSKKGFLYNYLRDFNNNNDLKKKLMEKRNRFIKRTLPAFKKNPTYRRYLSLIAWFYQVFDPKRYYSNIQQPFNNIEKFKKAKERYKELEKRKITGEQSKKDKKRESTPSNYTIYMKKNNIPTNKKDLSKYLKENNKTNLSINKIKKLLDDIYDRGLKAWQTSGSRPGTNKYQWGKARLYSFIYHIMENKTKELKHDKDILKKL